MIKKSIYKLQSIGLKHIHDYETKKQLASFNGLFSFILFFLIINIFITLSEKFYFLLTANASLAIIVLFCLHLNKKNVFNISKHIALFSSGLYILYFSICCGKEIAFENYYLIYIVMVSFIITKPKELIVYFIVILMSYYITIYSYNNMLPLEIVGPTKYSFYNINNTTMLLILCAVLAGLFRSQNSKFLKEIMNQKQKVEEHQKEILDSIHYAKRIQTALLANKEFVNTNIKNNFIYFQPKDIVSGDFYWATQQNDCFYLACCDSTGHGVPGAFMSLLNIGFLSEAIKEKNISQPNEIFNYVRKRLIESISSEGQKDGFDGILIKIKSSDLQSNQSSISIEYSAANNEPILISNNQIIELPKDKMPVGQGERKESFALHTLELKKGETLYLYTDGYADQFGGEKGKKFKYKQLNELLLHIHQLPMQEQEQKLSTTFNNWKGNLEQVDDVCMVGIKI